MVLQKDGARVWGYANTVGEEVTVELLDIDTYPTTSYLGETLLLHDIQILL